MWKWQRAVAKDTKGKAFQINKPMGLTMEEVEKRLPVIMPDITKLECPPAGRIQATCKCATSVQTCGLKRGANGAACTTVIPPMWATTCAFLNYV